MSRTMEAVGLDFIERAPLQLTFNADMAAPPDRVYAALADDLATWTWFPTLTGGHTLSERREEVGARCEVHIGGLTAIETILAAEPGRRWAYRVTELPIPLASALVEDWVLTPVPASSTRPLGTHVAYTFALDPRPLAAYLTTFSAASIAAVFGKAASNLDRMLADQATRVG
jgi:hypothetical protein